MWGFQQLGVQIPQLIVCFVMAISCIFLFFGCYDAWKWFNDWRKLADKKELHGVIILATSLILLIVSISGIIYGLKQINRRQSEKSPSQKVKEIESLHDFFESDFSNLHRLRIIKEFETNRSPIARIKLEYREYQDDRANSKFYAIYIPRSPISFCILQSIEDHKRVFKEIGSSIISSSRYPGEPLTINSTDLVFSGRVYFYHENDFSLRQKADLEELYKNNNMRIQFRGNDYVAAQLLSKS